MALEELGKEKKTKEKKIRHVFFCYNNNINMFHLFEIGIGRRRFIVKRALPSFKTLLENRLPRTLKAFIWITDFIRNIWFITNKHQCIFTFITRSKIDDICQQNRFADECKIRCVNRSISFKRIAHVSIEVLFSCCNKS